MKVSDPIINNKFSLPDLTIRQRETTKPMGKPETGSSFREILNQQLRPTVSFSKHANLRVNERNIHVSESDLTRLGNACDKAQEKGIKDALILMNDSAFIVNAPGKVVITVVDKKEMEDSVITNIDGAVLL